MRKLLLLTLVFLMFLTVSCNKKMIKGTTIEDTQDARDILTIFGHYIKGINEQNPDIFLEYVSKNYYDINGSDDPADDVDYDKLVEILQSDAFTNLKKLSITCIIKDLLFDSDERNRAKLLFFFEVRFKMKSSLPAEENEFVQADGMTNHKISENKQINFVKEDDKWKIVSGL